MLQSFCIFFFRNSLAQKLQICLNLWVFFFIIFRLMSSDDAYPILNLFLFVNTLNCICLCGTQQLTQYVFPRVSEQTDSLRYTYCDKKSWEETKGIHAHSYAQAYAGFFWENSRHLRHMDTFHFQHCKCMNSHFCVELSE